jgi:hypothetical protein
MPAKKYRAELSTEERAELNGLLRKGTCAAHKRRHAEVLLKADEGAEGPAWMDQPINEAFGGGCPYCGTYPAALGGTGFGDSFEPDQTAAYRASRLDGEQEAHLAAYEQPYDPKCPSNTYWMCATRTQIRFNW